MFIGRKSLVRNDGSPRINEELVLAAQREQANQDTGQCVRLFPREQRVH